jgi:hypothetical protein
MTKYNRKEVIGKPVLTIRNGKARIGVATSVGPKQVGLTVLNMETRTFIPLSPDNNKEELIPIMCYVTPECLSMIEDILQPKEG